MSLDPPMSPDPRATPSPWAWLGLLWVLLGLACRPSEVDPLTLDDPPVPEATVVARLDPDGVPPWSQGAPLAEPLPPEVVDAGPEGDVGAYPSIFVRFNQSMVEPADGAPPLVRLQPEVPGTVRWPDAYQLVFSPHHPLEPGQPYEVIVEGTLTTVDGRAMALSRRWTIDVERVRVDMFVVDDNDYPYYVSDGHAPTTHWKAKMIVAVDRPATLPALRKALVVEGRPAPAPGAEDAGTTAAEAKPRTLDARTRKATARERRHWGWDEDPRDFYVVEPIAHWPADTVVSVRVDADFVPRDDVLALGRPIEARLQTQPGLGATLRCALEYDDGCDPGPLWLSLDNPIPRAELAKIEVSPRPARLKVSGDDEYAAGITDVEIFGRFQPDRSYTVTIPASFHDVHGQGLSEAITQEIRFVMPPPSLALSSSRGFLPAEGAGSGTTVGIEARSVSRVALRVAVLDDDAAVARASLRVDEGRFPSEGAEVIEQVIDLDPKGRFEWSSRPLDLATFTKGKRRPVFVEVRPLLLTPAAAGRTMPTMVRGLYQLTDLGAIAISSSSRSVARVSRLSTGEPRAGVEVQLFRRDPALPTTAIGELARTDDDGLAPLPGWGSSADDEGLLLVHDPSADDRFVMGPKWLGELSAPPAEGYRRGERVLTTVVTERPLYRPGETIHLVGWAAVSTPHTPSGLRPVPAKTPVEITLHDGSGDVVLRREVRLKQYGKYWATLALPSDLRLGAYSVRAELVGASARADVHLRQFRTPPFAVDAAIDRGDFLHRQSPRITVGASYYFGGRVPIATARRHEECWATSFRPAGLDPQWVVGHSTVAQPYSGSRRIGLSPDPEQQGRLQYDIDLLDLDRSWTYRCTTSVAVQDAAAAEVGAELSYLVHPERYLLLGSPLQRLEEGDTITLPLRTVTHEGRRLGGTPVRLEVEREFWAKDATGRWKERSETLPGCTATTTAKGADPQCRLAKLPRGHYSIVATTTDDEPAARVELGLWVGSRWKPVRAEKVTGLTLELSDPEPRPGDRVTVTVRSPQADARGVLMMMHGGLRTVEPFVLEGGRFEHSFTVLDAWVPSVDVEALVVHPTAKDPGRLIETAYGGFRVTPEHRALSVEVSAPDVAGPRQEIPIELLLHDAAGEPTAGHVTLWAVDEAVLSLAPPLIPDLVAAFVVERGDETNLLDDFEQRLFPYVVRDDPYAFGWEGGLGLSGYGAGGGGLGMGGGVGRGGGTTLTRKDFDATPIFLGDVEVGRSGKATARGTLPDDLTTFRITAIASAELEGGDAVGRFGHADTRVRVTAPLVVQAALPRHLRPGDRAEAAALVDDLGGPSGLLTVVIDVDDSEGALRVSSSPTATVRVEAGGQVRVPFEIEALGPGTPKVTLTAVLAADEGDARLSDAIELPVPVAIERSIVRQVATYGSVADDEPIAVALRRPPAARPGQGGIDVSLGSTLLGGAQDMVEGLVEYPYGCVEQTTSRLLPLAALGQLAPRYPLGVGDLDLFVREGVTRLQSMEVPGGGLGYWPGDTTPHAYATAYATWVLVQLRKAGYEVPRGFIVSQQEYLAKQVEGWASHGTPNVHDDVRLAMALVALAESDDEPRPALVALYERRKRLPLFTRAMVLVALHRSDPADARVATLAGELLEGLDERDGFAHVRDGGGWLGSFFDSGPRTEAMVLLALLQAAPDDRRVEKLTRGLMELRRHGAMRNTQERAYALLALAEHARRFEAEEPAFDGSVWVDADFIGRPRFEGRSGESQALELPLPWTEDAPAPGTDPFDGRVTLARRGRGRMYWRVAMRWVPEPATLRPHAAGITIERALRTEAGAVAEADAIASGQMVALDLTLTTNEVLDYVAIDVPLPAGLEAVDTTIGKGRRAMVLRGSQGWWVSHTELKTERALVFADRLPPGKHHHTVFLRAITPGDYVMPPSHAEAMYYPEIQGNTAPQRVRVR